jgi:acetyltransferase-like isoleucine patch superfamily enzyme
MHVHAGQLRQTLKPLARRALGLHLPVGRSCVALYRFHVAAREALIWALRFFWCEPLFRSQCASVGSGFQMECLPYLTGRGRIVIGNHVRLSGKSSFGFSSCITREPEISIGDGTFIGHDCHFGIAQSIRIGKHCLLAGGVSVRDLDGHPLDADERRAGRPAPRDGVRPVVIEDDAWIGARAMILKGVTVGARSVVGAGAVVSRDVPPDCVVAGNPARVVKQLVTRPAACRAGAA